MGPVICCTAERVESLAAGGIAQATSCSVPVLTSACVTSVRKLSSEEVAQKGGSEIYMQTLCKLESEPWVTRGTSTGKAATTESTNTGRSLCVKLEERSKSRDGAESMDQSSDEAQCQALPEEEL